MLARCYCQYPSTQLTNEFRNCFKNNAFKYLGQQETTTEQHSTKLKKIFMKAILQLGIVFGTCEGLMKTTSSTGR